VGDTASQASVDRVLAALTPIDASARRRALLIANPHATAVSDRLCNLVAYALAARYAVDVAQTQAPGHAIELARAAEGQGYELVIALGGDGTVNEIANGLAGSRIPLSCLPGGSANVVCKLLGLPSEIIDATEHLLSVADAFAPRLIDLAEVEGRLYVFSAGLGLDADVVRSVDARPAIKARFGPYFYLAVAAATFVGRYVVGPPRMFVTVGDDTFVGVTTVVQNAEHYSYFHDRPVDLAVGASLAGGTLSGAVLRRARLLGVPSLIVRAMRAGGRVPFHRQVDAFQGVTSLTVSSSGGRLIPLQVDGDFIATVSEARFAIRPGALWVLA
jgi:diacylglycerol kinase family enzyme